MWHFRAKLPKNRVFDLLDPGYTRYGMFYACLGKKMIFVKFWIFLTIFLDFIAKKHAKNHVFLCCLKLLRKIKNTMIFACFSVIKTRKMVEKVQKFTTFIFLSK